MNATTLIAPRPAEAWYEGGEIHLRLADGKYLAFPIQANARLATASPEQLNHIELSPFGLHWPDLDEDLTVEGILQNNWGQVAPSPSHSPR